MDPKQQISQLDPKIKEAYDRVMNSSVTPPPAPIVHTPEQAANVPVKPPVTPPPPSSPLPTAPVHTPITPPANPTVTPPVTSPHPTQPLQTIVTGTPQPSLLRREPETVHIGGSAPQAVKKKSSGVSPVIYIFGGIIFLVVYVIFWLKFFNVPVPFLPF